MDPRTVPDWSLGERIRKARTHAGLDQEQLASRLNVDRRTVSRWETDLTEPNATRLTALAEATGVPVEWLLGISAAAS